MKHLSLACAALLTLSACGPTTGTTLQGGRLTTVAEMDINPGNAAIAPDGRIFASIHQFRPTSVKLVEVATYDTYRPFPDAAWNDASKPAHQRLVAPLGVKVDRKNRLWVIDNGNEGKKAYTPKLLAFDLDSRKPVFQLDFPSHVAPSGGFAQDIAVDDARGFVYVADVGKKRAPGLIVVNINSKSSRRIEGLPGFKPEKMNMVVEGQTLTQGKGPARMGLNPLTLSADGEMLYFGAMTSMSWWQVPTALLREGAGAAQLAKAVTKAGPKPISDGAATDASGNHYFTDLNHDAITALTKKGQLVVLAHDHRLSWPDSIAIDHNGDLIIAVNQLHQSPALNGGRDEGKGPYRIMRLSIDGQ